MIHVHLGNFVKVEVYILLCLFYDHSIQNNSNNKVSRLRD